MISKSVAARNHSRRFATGIDYITEHAHERACRQAGRSFGDGIGYASAPKKAAWVQLRGVTSVETAAIEMEAVAALSRRCKDPVYHLIIAYAKGEHPTREQVVSDAERLLKSIGMERNQYVLAAHQDTDNYHAHVIANRIGPDGKANDLWQERIKRERVCAQIAAERGWEIVVGRHNRDIVQRVRHLYAPPPDPERRLSDGAYRRLRERGELPWQESARPYVLDAVDRAKDWSELSGSPRTASSRSSFGAASGYGVWHSPKGSSAARRVVRRRASIRGARCRRLSGASGRSRRRTKWRGK
ncbi:MAG TPA: relaxase/mobilization nuclease domain-containing protein [Candidatus Cybelea sp.]|nr:relaxase/mobilization nuclease domain-containing protein [Candidatus Cybelea sp.]